MHPAGEIKIRPFMPRVDKEGPHGISELWLQSHPSLQRMKVFFAVKGSTSSGILALGVVCTTSVLRVRHC